MNKKIVNITGYILVCISFLFILKRFAGMGADWKSLAAAPVVLLLVTMPFLNVTVIFLNAFCWGRSLALFASCPVYNGDVFAVYAKSNLAKYLPGNVGHYAARQMFASQIGIRQAHIALASVFEVGYSSCAMLLLSMVFSGGAVLRLVREQLSHGKTVCLGIAIVSALAAVFVVGARFRRNKYVAEIYSLAAMPQFWLSMLRSVLLFTGSTAVIGAVFVLVVCQYVQVSFEGAFLLMGGCTASYLVGFITPGAPGGIGVREAAMLLLLEPYFPGDKILLAAVVQRLITVIGDIIVYPVSRLFQTG